MPIVIAHLSPSSVTLFDIATVNMVDCALVLLLFNRQQLELLAMIPTNQATEFDHLIQTWLLDQN